MKNVVKFLQLVSASLLVTSTTLAFGQACMPVANTPVTLDGIVVGSGIAPGGGGGGNPPPSCSADPGWAGVVEQPISVFGMNPDTHVARLFVNGHGGPNLDHIYVGVHVENASDLTTNDKVTLYFHFGTGTNFQNPDFALSLQIGGQQNAPDATPTDSGCNADLNLVSYYTFSGGNWQLQGSVPTAIQVKKSWDFTTTDDPEIGIWEAEISVDLGQLGITVPAGGTSTPFALGAKLYLYEVGINQFTSYRYPSGLTTDNSPFDNDPNQSNVTPATLQAYKIGASCSNDVIISGFSASDAAGHANDFTLLKNTDFDTNGNAKIQNHFTASVKFINPSNPADNSTIAVPNTGQVQFHILPWNGDFTGNFLMDNPTTSFIRLNQENKISLDWPKTLSQWTAGGASTTITGANHACLKINLNGFTVNLNEAGDVVQQNLTYTTASTIKDSFLISANRKEQPNLEEGGYFTYILRVNWRNTANRPGWKYDFPNAAAIGLKPIKKGYYELKLKAGDEKRIAVVLSGGTMPGSTRQLYVPATAGGKLLQPATGTAPLSIPVNVSAVITIVTQGLIRTAGDNVLPNDANGFNVREGQSNRMLLHPGHYQPLQNVGALIGSFDPGFKRAFVVGNNSSFIVPAKATRLYLAVNDFAGQYGDNTGKFEVNVVVNNPQRLPTKLGGIPDVIAGVPVQMPAGSMIPRFDVDIMLSDKAHKLLLPTGYVSWAVYATHPTP